MRRLEPGYRVFICTSCGHSWKEPTRDWQSPSGENCPKCCEFCSVDDAYPDLTLPVNESGNLV